jgi:hypothetical protein
MAGKFLRKLQFDEEVEDMLDSVRKHFRAINEGDGLTPEDKNRLNAYYLEHLITPRARKLLQKRFPEDFAAEKSAGAHPK